MRSSKVPWQTPAPRDPAENDPTRLFSAGGARARGLGRLSRNFPRGCVLPVLVFSSFHPWISANFGPFLPKSAPSTARGSRPRPCAERTPAVPGGCRARSFVTLSRNFYRRQKLAWKISNPNLRLPRAPRETFLRAIAAASRCSRAGGCAGAFWDHSQNLRAAHIVGQGLVLPAPL